MSRGTDRSTQNRRHDPALDGVRGLAILGVLVAHLFVAPAVSPLGRAAQAVVSYAGLGVTLFFVLSGFLITGILADSVKEPHFFRVFYVRRILRIAPLYYAVLFGFALAAWTGAAKYGGELRSLALYLQNTNLLAPAIWFYQGPSKLPLMHFWTLAVEEQFYLVWPLVVFALKARKDVFWASIAGVVFSVFLRFWMLTHGASDVDVRGMTACRLDTLLLGGALAMLIRSRWQARTIAAGPWMLVGGIVTAIVSYRSGMPNAAAVTVSYLAFALVCGGLLLLAEGAGRAFFSAASLRWLGRYSYGLYVFHYILLGFWLTALRAWLSRHGLGEPSAVVTAGLLIGAASVAAAVFSYEFYEKRFLRLKRFVPYAGTNREASDPA